MLFFLTLIFLILSLSSFTLQDCGRILHNPEATVGGNEAVHAPWAVSIGYHDENVSGDIDIVRIQWQWHCYRENITISVLDQYYHQLLSLLLLIVPENFKSRVNCFFINSCILQFNRRDYDIHAGKLNPRLMGVEERSIERYVEHPKYDGRSQYFDVSLLFLEKVNR